MIGLSVSPFFACAVSSYYIQSLISNLLLLMLTCTHSELCLMQFGLPENIIHVISQQIRHI
jgi:hypothetical protein